MPELVDRRCERGAHLTEELAPCPERYGRDLLGSNGPSSPGMGVAHLVSVVQSDGGEGHVAACQRPLARSSRGVVRGGAVTV